MKQNKITPGSNMMWEGSRMMLPEHKEQILDHRRNLGKRERPIHDENQLEQWSQILSAGMADGREVTVTVFDPYGDVRLSGTVEKFDPVQRRIKLLQVGNEAIWVQLANVTGIDWV